ncbi:large ribosomal subunit protein uL22m-like [Physella acuta]|uniref:large ribosomal subunit protein uL22m-like n=1 Tax=Physella acuta TaxID=109671 RepID=UPI0027DD9F79|nr:large ribosomal subunit protein uL22m-like [Physella acuta]XP_059152065.1 large ribosomal subunit protein uL22m-like [Physella acuta]
MATFKHGICLLNSVAQFQQCIIQPSRASFMRCLHSISSSLIPTKPTRILGVTSASNSSTLHTSSLQYGYRNTEFERGAPKRVGKAKLVPPNWLKYNRVLYPPTPLGGLERPAEVCHARMQIKYSTKKLWYIAQMIRGMSIDEAIKQLSFHKRKGAAHIKEVLEEAQEKAVTSHNVEFKSNLWICDSFVSKGIIIKGVRKHARMRFGVIQYRYTNYFLRLREGKPPKDYYPPEKTGNELMQDYIRRQRSRVIQYGL